MNLSYCPCTNHGDPQRQGGVQVPQKNPPRISVALVSYLWTIGIKKCPSRAYAKYPRSKFIDTNGFPNTLATITLKPISLMVHVCGFFQKFMTCMRHAARGLWGPPGFPATNHPCLGQLKPGVPALGSVLAFPFLKAQFGFEK